VLDDVFAGVCRCASETHGGDTGYTQGSPGPVPYTSGKHADQELGKMEETRDGDYFMDRYRSADLAKCTAGLVGEMYE
jgi:hypothetical protein